jgi:tRNA-2-methylthio-N6-dimethylallyladenosine synthase
LFEVVEEQGRAHLASLVGTRQRVLVEGESKAGAGRVQGRTERNEIVHLDAPDGARVVGEMVEVLIASANKHSLMGEITAEARAALPRATPVLGARRALPILAHE